MTKRGLCKMDLLLYLIIISLGIFIGNKKLLKEPIMKKLDSIQTLSILLLLFIMGINIGMDREVIFSFATIGGQALVLATFSIIFSVLAVKMVSKYIDLNKTEKPEESISFLNRPEESRKSISLQSKNKIKAYKCPEGGE